MIGLIIPLSCCSFLRSNIVFGETSIALAASFIELYSTVVFVKLSVTMTLIPIVLRIFSLDSSECLRNFILAIASAVCLRNLNLASVASQCLRPKLATLIFSIASVVCAYPKLEPAVFNML